MTALQGLLIGFAACWLALSLVVFFDKDRRPTPKDQP